MRVLFRLRAIAFASILWPLPALIAEEAFVSLSKEQMIAVFDVDDTTGRLTSVAQWKTPGQPGAMAFNQSGDRLYVAMKSKGGIATFETGDAGESRMLGTVEMDGSAGFLHVHPSGGYLFCSYYAEGMTSVHRIEEDGRLSKDPVQVVSTDERAHAVMTDPSGEFLFVPHTRPNSIHQFRFSSESGLLATNAPALLQREELSGPRHLWFHPTKPFAFGSDEQGKAVTSYRLSETGTLSVLETVPSFPEDYLEKGSTADIEVHPSGRFVYIANRGLNTVAAFAIDPESGGLSLLGQSEVEPVPRSFNISHDGSYLVSAGQQSGNLVAFQIDARGRLVETDRVPSGGSPWWVAFRP